MATTSPDNIWTPDGGDAYALTVDLAAMADTVQDALNKRSTVRSGAGAPTVQPGDALGATYVDTATGARYWFDGTIWLLNAPGLNAVVPTAVSGATVSVATISFSGSSGVSVNGVFTSRFRNYLIKLTYTCSTQARMSMRLRASGTDAAGATDYKNQYILNNTDSALSTSLEQITQWNLSAGTGTRHSTDVELFNPQRAQPTDIMARSITLANPSISALSTLLSGQHVLSTAYDGLRLVPSAGTVTGELTVYGLA